MCCLSHKYSENVSFSCYLLAYAVSIHIWKMNVDEVRFLAKKTKTKQNKIKNKKDNKNKIKQTFTPEMS